MYDEIATLYNLFYRDWNAVMAQQASALDAIIRQHVGPPPQSILEESSFIDIQRLDGVLYQHQPLLVARRGTS